MQRYIIKIVTFLLLLLVLGIYILSVEPIIVPWSIWVFLLLCINLVIWTRLMRLATFTILVIWSYALLGNLIPETAAGPSISMGDLERTPESFVVAGDAIYHGKGKCATCHTIGAGATEPRCPDLENINILAESRNPDMSVKDYFVESLYLPNSYLVEGYGNIMPEIWKPPIALTPLEIETVIAYLQSLGGEPDVSPITPPVDITAYEKVEQRELKGNLDIGRNLFVEDLECIRCHKVGEKGGNATTGEVGPDLTEIGALNTIDYIEESIIDPNARIVKGFEWVSIHLKNGESLNGSIIKVEKNSLTIRSEKIKEEDDWDWDEEEEIETESEDDEEIEERIVIKKEIAFLPVWNMDDVIGQGYFWIEAVVNDSIKINGSINREDKISFTIESGDTLVKIFKDEVTDIKGQQIRISSKMPGYDEIITLRQFEDLVTFLASLKGTDSE